MAEDRNHLHVTFFSEPIENPAKTAKEGRPVFEDTEFVRIKFVGDPKNELVAPANSQSIFDREQRRYLTYKERFPRHYEAFKANEAFIGEGTPLKEAGFLSAARVKELSLASIHTVEALAGLDGANLQRLGMGAREWKTKAEAYLANQNGNAGVMKIASENAALKEQLEAMQRQMNELIMARNVAPVAQVKPDLGAIDAVVERTAVNAASPFAEWKPEDIKAFIKDRTGSAPRGNPSMATLVDMADEVVASEPEKAA